MPLSKLGSNTFVSDSLLIQHYLTIMKDARCPNAQFRQLTADITRLLIYEALENLTVPAHLVTAKDTRGIEYDGLFLDTSDFVLIGVVRSGMPMAAAAQSVFPDAQLGTVGYDATHDPAIFYEAAPQLDGKFTFIFDPALATGKTALNVAKLLTGTGKNEYEGEFSRMAIITLTTQAEARALIEKEAPGLTIISAAARGEFSQGDNASAGLGDVQSRLFGNRYREGYIL